jgi:hypothetical protein
MYPAAAISTDATESKIKFQPSIWSYSRAVVLYPEQHVKRI